MISPTESVILARDPDLLRPDPRRVIARLFVPGHELPLAHGQSRLTVVLERILALSPAEAEVTLDATIASFGRRHADLRGLLAENFDRSRTGSGRSDNLPEATRLPDRFVLHRTSTRSRRPRCSTPRSWPTRTSGGAGRPDAVPAQPAGGGRGSPVLIEFRTGLVVPTGGCASTSRRRTSWSAASTRPASTSGVPLRAERARRRRRGAAFVLDGLPDPFTASQLEAAS